MRVGKHNNKALFFLWVASIVPVLLGHLTNALAFSRGVSAVEHVQAEVVIGKFLSKRSPSLEDFYIHGWRWHTMSLVREVERLRKLATSIQQRFSTNGVQECETNEAFDRDLNNALKLAADYVVGFNLKGLHKIEENLFFPWMREKLTSSSERELSQAFAVVMDQLEIDRQKVSELGESISRNTIIAGDASSSDEARSNALDSIVQESAALADFTRSMMDRENSLLVPAVADLVAESEQKKFNTKVLMNLGLLDSRLHLVGMHEAVLEADNPVERQLFQREIPSLPQMMIPRWKRNLYEPQTHVLDLKGISQHTQP